MAAKPKPQDLESLWLPFTSNRAFKKKPRLVSRAEGMYYWTPEGKQILDGVAGLWCCNAGHNHPKIQAAIQKQAAEMDFAPHFNFAHPAAFEAAARLCEDTPEDIKHVFFTNSGSESVDTALKIALAYHRERGDSARTKLIGREKGYHGVGFGGISVGGIAPNRRQFSASLLPGVDHLPHTHDLERNAFSRGLPDHGAERADVLEALAQLHHPSTIAAVIVEPVAGSAGVLLPPVGYLQRLREICDRHGILLIFDEVITAFGRLGSAYGSQALGVTPDIITTAKGLTSGTVPMGAVFVRDGIYDAFMEGPGHAIELFHGYTYSAHPLAVAACKATQDVYRDEGLFERAGEMAPVFEEALHSLAGEPYVIDVRNYGLMGAVELQGIEGKPGERGLDAMIRAFEDGAMVRVTGDTLAFSPPLIIEETHIEQLLESVRRVLRSLH
jgi:beta-alanine--pyruvate transaminase